MQVAYDQHHRKEQDRGGKVNEVYGFARGNDPEGHHRHRTNNGRAGPVDFESGELSKGKDEITGDED